MPQPVKIKSFYSLIKRLRGCLLKIFLPWALSLVFALFIYQKAEDLLENPKSDNKPSFNSESHPEVVVQPVAPKQKSPALENTPDEWCDPES